MQTPSSAAVFSLETHRRTMPSVEPAYRRRPALRPLDPQMRVDIASANAAFLKALIQHAPVKLPESAQPSAPQVQKKPIATPSPDKEKVPLEQRFSLAGLPVLAERVPSAHLPEELLVFDRGDVTGRHPRRPDAALRYVRAYPRLPKARAPGQADADAPLRRGYLFLDRANRLAEGRRSEVYRAPLLAALAPRGSGREPRNVAVVAKLARGDCRSHHLLRQEGKAHAALPAQVTTPAAEDEDGPAAGGPLVPHFYGIYVPVDSKGRRMCGEHPHCDGYLHSDCAVEWPSPILLTEDCGSPVDVGSMSKAARMECWSLIERLHAAGVAHGSAHARNMLVQPGPLDRPREQRSLATPSYRIASLGRAEVLWPRHGRGEPSRLATNSFEKARERDMQVGFFELRPWEEEEKDPPAMEM